MNFFKYFFNNFIWRHIAYVVRDTKDFNGISKSAQASFSWWNKARADVFDKNKKDL